MAAEVIVVGAGLAGLVAARQLARAGRDVLVVEARDRVGGRTLSTNLSGQIVDLGGQWIGDRHIRVRALADELDVATFPQHATGKKILDCGGRLRSFSGFLPRLPLHALAELGLALAYAERLARGVPLAAPLDARHAERWDRQSLADWADAHVHTRAARDMVNLFAQMLFAAEPREISMLYFLMYAHAGGGLRRLADIEKGAQERRFVSGAQSLSMRLAAELGSRIRLAEPARAIAQDAAGVTVTTSRGAIRAARVILALPPALLGRIEFAPAVSPQRARLHAGMRPGAVIKCIAAYARPFWRHAGYSGEALSPAGLVRATFDATSADGVHAALVAFIVGDAARALSQASDEQRQARVVAELARLHGPAAAAPIGYADYNWLVDEWSGGCYVGLAAPRLLTDASVALRAAEGRLHFAGTETALEHVGYLEGAIESGERAAREVLAASATGGAAPPTPAAATAS
jgi:monoamine oxidase